VILLVTDPRPFSVDRLIKLLKLDGMIVLPFFHPSRIAPIVRARDGATLDES
jgi:hypothetical protein